MNYWHMQLHPNEPSWGREREILENCGLIGMGDWKEGGAQQYNFEHTMQKGDIVLIKLAGEIIALTEVIGDYNYEDEVDDLEWFQRRRLIKILDWYKPEYKLYVNQRGTLTRCNIYNDNPTNKSILKWHKMTIEKAKMETYTNILKNLKPQMILQGPPGTGKTYTAKEIAYSMIFDKTISKDEKQKRDEMILLENTGQYKLIQFHPAYSYEDFVRGITAKTNGNSIEYATVNRILAAFAETANENYNDSRKDSKLYTKEKWIKEQLAAFIENIQDSIETDLKYEINKTAYIFDIEDDAFRYTGDNWPQKTGLRMKFNDIILMYLNDIKTRQDVKAQKDISGLARQHATYFFKFFQKFQAFLSDKEFNEEIVERVLEKNYVLIIDEINRANLPAVLGELIYALEYRGEPVEGMYELDGDRKIVLPPNLFFICTMNTADRSVGHIDYAIRRRFAFVNCPPIKSVIDEVITDLAVKQKANDLYDKVELLFDSKTLASDFNKNDVQIGHSYFLAQTPDELNLKKDFEIKPILKEYLKDGILLSKINSLGIDETLQFIEQL